MTKKIGLKLLDTQQANDGEIIIYSSANAALEFSSAVGGSSVTVYATAEELPTSGNTLGDEAYVSSTNKYYYWANQWKNITLNSL
jgi:hypothetical protein